MITPLQQTPIPLDPVRQQVAPTAPIEMPAPLPPTETALPSADNSRDQFDTQQDNQRRERSQTALEDQQRFETASKLRIAYVRLAELQRETKNAVSSGDATRAKELASEATVVAQTIPANVGVVEKAMQGADTAPLTSSSSGSATTSSAAQQTAPVQQSVSVSATGSATDRATSSAAATDALAAAIGVARSSLSTARDVVETAASVPYHPVEDRVAINGMRAEITKAMAGVEQIAARTGDANSIAYVGGASQRIDFRA